jgi:hypothetical protein
MAKVVEHLPSKNEAPNSTNTTTENGRLKMLSVGIFPARKTGLM